MYIDGQKRAEIYISTDSVVKHGDTTPQKKLSQSVANVPSGRYATIGQHNDSTHATLRGHVADAYTDTYVRDVIAHVQDLICADMRIRNVTAPNCEFVAIGIRTRAYIGCPVLAHNVVTDEWIFAHNAVWYDKKNGFCWDSGTYTDEQHARALFKKECADVLYHTEAY